MRVLVTGGRIFANLDAARAAPRDPGGRAIALAQAQLDFVLRILDGIHAGAGLEASDGRVMLGVDLLIHGGAGGVDSVARAWAVSRSVPHVEVFVNAAAWARHGKFAGHNRNRRMLLDHCPDLVVAFPGETGTHDCVAQARGMRVLVYEPRWGGHG